MARKGYKFAVQWIATNDEPLETDLDEIQGYISTLLVADIFGKEPEKVATDILRLRRQELKDYFGSK